MVLGLRKGHNRGLVRSVSRWSLCASYICILALYKLCIARPLFHVYPRLLVFNPQTTRPPSGLLPPDHLCRCPFHHPHPDAPGGSRVLLWWMAPALRLFPVRTPEVQLRGCNQLVNINFRNLKVLFPDLWGRNGGRPEFCGEQRLCADC